MHQKQKVRALLLPVCMIVGLLPWSALPARAESDAGTVCLVTNGASFAEIGGIVGGQGSSIYFGAYSQSSDGNDGFNNDPVKWRVLENANGRLFLLSDTVLDMAQYHTAPNVSVTWATSTTRSWLNGYGTASNGAGTDYSRDNFKDKAFAAPEDAAIAVTDGLDSYNSTYSDVPRGETVSDKVFLLSVDEAATTAYGFSGNPSAYSDASGRQAVNTDYTEAGGSIKATGIGIAGQAAPYWLRSSGYQGTSAAGVSYWGQLAANGYDTSNVCAVRPAVNLDLSKVLFASPAEGGKTASGALALVDSWDGSDWKLTIEDANRTFAVTETSAGVDAGKAVKLHYTGATVYNATTAPNEYVSAILADENGEALYYARLTQPTATGGELSVTIPNLLATGKYTLKLFSEQCNGDKKTDYASAFDDVVLTVRGTVDFGVTGNLSSGELVATVTLPVNAKALLIAASYDSAGRQVGVRVIKTENGKTTYETGLTRTSGYTYKLMVVNRATYAPLFAAWDGKT